MPKRALAEDLAGALLVAAAGQRQAGRALHDDIGPLLSAAGLRLGILRMDFPDAAERVREVTEVLEDAMERVRVLSQQLNPSPVHRMGFQNALGAMLESHRRRFTGKLQLRFTATTRLPPEAAVAMYEAADAALSDAVDCSDASRIDVSVSSTKGGSGTVSLRVKDNGKRRRSHREPSHRALARAALLAHAAGLGFEASTENGTIVWIKYALRRSSRG
jgi:signal transduction histidine kinase